jgi:inactive STAND
VSDHRCKLNTKGIAARDELLCLLRLAPGGRIGTKVANIVGLDRATITSWLLEKSPKDNHAVPADKLKQFFVKLVEAVADRHKGQFYEGNIIDAGLQQRLKRREIITDVGLRRYLWGYVNHDAREKASWVVPAHLYDEVLANAESTLIRKRYKLRKVQTTANQSIDVIDLLWHLDYKQQERAFEDALDEPSKCAAFSIVAPCETTQRWILNRLIRKISPPESVLILPPISLRQHPMRNQFEHFWEDLSRHFGTKPEPAAVLKGICHTDVNRPIILTVYGFRQFESVQRRILDEFWEPLTQTIADSQRTERSRVVLFWVDQDCPSHDTQKVLKLDPLEKIPQKDVRSWLNSPSIVSWWQPKGDERFVDHLLDELIADNCQDPYAVLDKMCFKFGVEGGIVDVEEAWKWAS